jgi:hypothetical protein
MRVLLGLCHCLGSPRGKILLRQEVGRCESSLNSKSFAIGGIQGMSNKWGALYTLVTTMLMALAKCS